MVHWHSCRRIIFHPCQRANFQHARFVVLYRSRRRHESPGAGIWRGRGGGAADGAKGGSGGNGAAANCPGLGYSRSGAGGGGFTAGTGGSGFSDFFTAIAGGGGRSCHHNSTDTSSISIAATGGTGATGRTTRAPRAGPAGSNGSTAIMLGPLEVQKASTVAADAISASNFKSLPGATIRCCIVIRNNWGGDATDVVLTNSLPAQTSIVANRFNKGTTCADETNNEPLTSITGSTVIANIGSLATSASYALVFQVTLN